MTIIVEQAAAGAEVPGGIRAAALRKPGLDARQTWDDAFTLNRWTDDAGAELWPRVLIDEIEGWRSRPDAEDNRDPAIGRIGEIPRRGQLRGKSLTYKGRVEALSATELEGYADEFEAAFCHTETGRMVGTTHPLRPHQAAVVFEAEPTGFDCPEELTYGPHHENRGFGRPFVLTLRMSDPRFYALDGVAIASGEAPVVAFSAGGLALPQTPPVSPPAIAPASLPIYAAPPPDTVYAFNAGKAPVDPLIEVDGSSPVLEALTLGKELVLTGAGAGTHVVDFRRRTVTTNGQDRPDLPDLALSDWWDEAIHGLVPGLNEIRVAGAGPGAVRVRFRPALW